MITQGTLLKIGSKNTGTEKLFNTLQLPAFNKREKYLCISFTTETSFINASVSRSRAEINASLRASCTDHALNRAARSTTLDGIHLN